MARSEESLPVVAEENSVVAEENSVVAEGPEEPDYSIVAERPPSAEPSDQRPSVGAGQPSSSSVVVKSNTTGNETQFRRRETVFR